jgi:hypothetical protein
MMSYMLALMDWICIWTVGVDSKGVGHGRSALVDLFYITV